MAKERFQNPAVGDQINLRLFSFNANAPKDFESVNKVEIYFLDPNAITDTNKNGKTLVTTVSAASVVQDRTGEYHITLDLEKDYYVIGEYLDVWYITIEGTETMTISQRWDILPALWFTTPSPLAYDFTFDFRPNRIRKGSKRYLVINVTPNVPTAPDLCKYYAALIVTAPIKIYIQLECGQCMPESDDLRMIVEGDPVLYRERNDAFYQIDTANFDEGIYNVWFEMELGDNLYISEKQQLQIY